MDSADHRRLYHYFVRFVFQKLILAIIPALIYVLNVNTTVDNSWTVLESKLNIGSNNRRFVLPVEKSYYTGALLIPINIKYLYNRVLYVECILQTHYTGVSVCTALTYTSMHDGIHMYT